MLPVVEDNRSVQVFDEPVIGESAKRYVRSARPQNTKDTYRKAMERYADWCNNSNFRVLPASVATIAEYLTWMADAKFSLSAIEISRSAISAAHQASKLPDPTKTNDIKSLMYGISREIGKPPVKKLPLSRSDLVLMCQATNETLLGHRDRAMILIGFAGAFRRSELVELNVSDIDFKQSKVVITVRKSKTDQTGNGLKKNIPSIDDPAIDPVMALRKWLSISGITTGPIFRRVDRWDHLRVEKLKPQAVAMIIKRYATICGLDPSRLSGHSLRSGFITSAADANMPTWAIKEQTGHKSDAVLQGYIQDSGRGAERVVRAILDREKDS